jgi:hypothetical protein
MIIEGVTPMYRERAYVVRARVNFDPTNKQHRLDYAQFIKYNNWKDGCRYLLEEPYMDIPTMINDKLVNYYLKPLLEKL